MPTRRSILCAAAGLGLARGASATPAALRIAGTGMALPAVQLVAARFMAGNPGIAVTVLPSLGTGGGINAVAAGAVELSLAARPLRAEDRARGLDSRPYARTPFLFVTHPQTAAPEPVLDQIAAIYGGQMTQWPDGTRVRLVRREPGDADWELLRGISPAMAAAAESAAHRPGLMTSSTDQSNADALERLRGSFGAMSLGQLRAENRQLRILPLEGVPPMRNGTANPDYPIWRTLHVVWRGEPAGPVAGFLDYLLGPDGQAVLGANGYLGLEDGA